MTAGGYAFMAIAWGAVLALVIFSMYRLFFSRRR
jgi:Zn-dependent protease with chaperone function